jgi:hypothetical protein
MRRKVVVIFLCLVIIPLLLFLLPFPQPPKYPLVLPQSVSIYAQVGRYFLESLSGWSSPFAEVTLTSQNLIQKTTCDQNGFFIFQSILIPDQLGELCLISQDREGLPSFPVCLAPPPGNQNLMIKNVLLPPTLSVEGSQIPNGKTAKASGRTFLNAEVDVYLFTENRFSWGTWGENLLKHFSWVKPAWAMGLPKYRIKTDQSGQFEFSLPATAPSFNRVYAAAIFISPEVGASRSPKSNTLAFETVGWLGWLIFLLRYLWTSFLAFLAYLKTHPTQILLGELLILAAFILFLLTAALERKPKEN